MKKKTCPYYNEEYENNCDKDDCSCDIFGIKPYFAKYLPVEGHIKDGTKVMFKIGNKWNEPCDFDSYMGPQIQEVAQGKLFLCSRDIQVGDIAQQEYKYLDTLVLNEAVLKLMREDGNWFKVIGEISPDAT